MSIKTVAMTVFGAVLVCGAARADGLFDAYQAFCVKPMGQPAAALAAADALHFDQLPASSLKEYQDGFSEVAGRGNLKTHIVLIVGKTPETIAGRTRNAAYCMVMGRRAPSQPDTARAEFERWMAGIMPSAKGTYFFVEDAGHRQSFETIPPSRVISVLNSGKVRSAAIRNQGDLTKIVYTADAK